MNNQRLLIVANRLPVTVRAQGTGIETIASSGGLASGLGPWHRRSSGLWFGWPGDLSQATPAQQAHVGQQLAAPRMAPVPLSAAQIAGYYHGFSNGVLWPLFHYSIDRV